MRCGRVVRRRGPDRAGVGLLVYGLLVWWVAVVGARAEVLAQSPADESALAGLGLRVQLVADREVLLRGELDAPAGQFDALENLSMAPVTAGAYWPDASGRQVHWRTPLAVDRLGFDVSYRGPSDAVLRISLRVLSPASDGEAEETREVELPLEQLRRENLLIQIADGVRLWVGRTPGDPLRIDLDGGSGVIFSAGQRIDYRVAATGLPQLPERNPQLRLSLTSARGGEVLWQERVTLDETQRAALQNGSWVEDLASGSLTLPAREGVYRFAVQLVRGGGSRVLSQLAALPLEQGRAVVLERSAELVVLESEGPPAKSPPFTELKRWLPANRPLLGVRPETLLPETLRGDAVGAAESDQPLDRRSLGDAEVVALPAGASLSQTLPIAQRGYPHRLTIRYRRDEPVEFIAAVRQLGAAEQATHLGVDQIVSDPGRAVVDADRGWGEHTLTFWPRHDTPRLLLINPSGDRELVLGDLSMAAGPPRLPPADAAPGPGRMAAVYLDKPLLIDAFGASRGVDRERAASEANAGLALDDWTSFLAAGNRLVELVRARGGNAALLSVASEGGTLYPTLLSQSTPRYDTGRFFSDGRDPRRKDVLELLFRLFDRAGLRLIPVLDLSTPLPELERRLHDPKAIAEEDPEGLRWTDAVGRRLGEGATRTATTAAWYNVLDPRVQNALAELVAEVRDRYASHRGWGGLGLQVGPRSLLQLPGPQWGRDRRTLARFRRGVLEANQTPGARPTPGTPPEGADWNGWVDQGGRLAFARWQAAELTAFLQRLAGESSPEQPLVIVTADYPGPRADASERGVPQPSLQWAVLANDPRILPLRVLRRRGLREPALQLGDARLNEDYGWDRLLAEGRSGGREVGGATGGLLYWPPTEIARRAAHVAKLRPPGCESLTLYPQLAMHEHVQCRQLARLLGTLDSQLMALGGWLPPLGTTRSVAAGGSSTADPASTVSPASAADSSPPDATVGSGEVHSVVAEWLLTYGQLPAVPFEEVAAAPGAARIVRVRQHLEGGRAVVYIVNPSPWPVRVVLQTAATAGTLVRRLGAGAEQWTIGSRGQWPDELVMRSAADGLSVAWSGLLSPGALVALEIGHPTGGVARWSDALVDRERVTGEVAAQIDRLARRVAVLGRPRPMPGLSNPSFEVGDESRIAGWLRAQHPPGSVRFTDQAADGRRALVLTNSDTQVSPTWLLSETFAPPETGRLVVSLRMRRLRGEPTVRLAVEGRREGQPVRYTVESRVPPGDWDAEPLTLRIDRLPAEGLEEVRVAIDLTSDGAVAVDDVQLFDFYLTDREREQLQRRTFVAAEQLRRGEFSESIRLLDSHWSRFLHWLEARQEETSESAPPASDPQQAGAEEATATTPVMAERLRQWLPAPLRF